MSSDRPVVEITKRDAELLSTIKGLSFFFTVDHLSRKLGGRGIDATYIAMYVAVHRLVKLGVLRPHPLTGGETHYYRWGGVDVRVKVDDRVDELQEVHREAIARAFSAVEA